jgi:hypothetical protein
VQRVLDREAVHVERFHRELRGFSKRERDTTLFDSDGRARLCRVVVAPLEAFIPHT